MNQISDYSMSTELDNSFEEEMELRDEFSKLGFLLRLVKGGGGFVAAAPSPLASAHGPLVFPNAVLILPIKF